MTTPSFAEITLRRRTLHLALTTLRPMDAIVLLALVVRAHPSNGRVWTTYERIGAELALSSALVADTIDRLMDHGFLHRIPSRPPVVSLEAGDLMVRGSGAPENLPVEPVV